MVNFSMWSVQGSVYAQAASNVQFACEVLAGCRVAYEAILIVECAYEVSSTCCGERQWESNIRSEPGVGLPPLPSTHCIPHIHTTVRSASATIPCAALGRRHCYTGKVTRRCLCVQHAVICGKHSTEITTHTSAIVTNIARVLQYSIAVESGHPLSYVIRKIQSSIRIFVSPSSSLDTVRHKEPSLHIKIIIVSHSTGSCDKAQELSMLPLLEEWSPSRPSLVPRLTWKSHGRVRRGTWLPCYHLHMRSL